MSELAPMKNYRHPGGSIFTSAFGHGTGGAILIVLGSRNVARAAARP